MKVALVTGGSRGIGCAICVRLAKERYYILINYQSNQAKAEETLALVREAGSDGELLPFDVANHADTQAVISAWQQTHTDEYIEVLVNNAGICRDELFVFMAKENWDRVLNVGLNGFYNTTAAVVQSMVKHKHGRIISIASVVGQKGMAGQANYAAAKAGIIAASKSLAQEVARRKVTVNTIAPGFIHSEMTAALAEDELKKTIPMNSFGEPEDVAAVVAFLASNDARYITGQCIGVNGGLYM